LIHVIHYTIDPNGGRDRGIDEREGGIEGGMSEFNIPMCRQDTTNLCRTTRSNSFCFALLNHKECRYIMKKSEGVRRNG
jgi:hypothetical protein